MFPIGGVPAEYSDAEVGTEGGTSLRAKSEGGKSPNSLITCQDLGVGKKKRARQMLDPFDNFHHGLLFCYFAILLKNKSN